MAHQRLKAELWLVLCTFMYGATFVLVHQTVRQLHPFYLLAVRFSCAALIVAPFIRKHLLAIDRHTLRRGLLLGLFVFSGFALQTIGLVDTTAAKSAFITGFLVVLTPFAERFVARTRITQAHWISVVLCTLGLYFLTIPADFTQNFALNRGDFLTLISSLMFALHIVYLERYSRQANHHSGHIWSLTFLQFITTAFLSWLGVLFVRATWPQLFSWGLLASMNYLIFAATIATFWLQTRFQGQTTSSRAALIFSLEPLFAFGFALLAGAENFSFRLLLGAFLMMMGLFISQLWPH